MTGFNTQPPKALKHDMTMLRRLSEIQRWAVVPVLRRQSVAEHSFHVACMARVVAKHHALLHTGNYHGELLNYALDHDRPESITGDKPSPYKKWLKKTNPGVTLEPGEAPFPTKDVASSMAIVQVVKIADYLEALLFLEEEVSLGNKRLQAVQIDVFDGFKQAWADFDWHGLPESTEIPFDDGGPPHKPSAPDYFTWWREMIRPDYHPGLEFDR